MLGEHVPVTEYKWIYLPWKWALRFGHDGWIKLNFAWLKEFRNGVPCEREDRSASRQHEVETRDAIAKFYQNLRESGDYPAGLPLSPAEIYAQAILPE